jgi:hypothetical protein
MGADRHYFWSSLNQLDSVIVNATVVSVPLRRVRSARALATAIFESEAVARVRQRLPPRLLLHSD